MKITVNNEYIKTQIGFLPIEWELETLENICIKKGLIRGPFGGALKKEYFKEQGIKVYEQKNAIYKDCSLGNYYIDNEKFEELKRFEVAEGDFIVSCSGTIGRIYKIPKEAEKGIINQALLIIKIDTQKINSNFFYQYFQWDNFQYRIIDNTQGGAMANLVSMEQFRKTIFPLPPLKEQEKIAEILSIWDLAIEKQELLIEKKKEFKKGLMQILLTGEVRFKEFKDEWKIVKLKDIIEESKEKSTENNQFNILSVTKNGIVLQSEYFNRQIASEDNTGYKVVRKNNLVFSAMNLWMGSIDILTQFDVGIVSPACKVFNINLNKADIDYFKELVRSKRMINLYNINSEQGASIVRRNLDLVGLLNSKIHIPSIEEQKKIGLVFKDIDKEIKLLEKELEVLKLQKKGLMQRLLTGEVRVKV